MAKKNKNKKINKVLKYFIIVCCLIVFCELIFIIYNKYKIDSSTIFHSINNDIAMIDNGYVVVGSSDFRYSDNYKYTGGYEKGKFIKYNNDHALQLERQYEKGYNTMFSSVLPLDDGYLVTGSGEFTKEQNKLHIRDALLVKYDLKGNIVWDKKYQVLDNSKFTHAVLVDDGYVVVGQSIYENMVIGNETTGGGIIVKYDFDGNVVWKNNYGGNKSAIFTDIAEISDGYVVVGKDAVDTGIIVKYDLNGNIVWAKNYSYTDRTGFTSIIHNDDYFLVAGGKKQSDADTDAVIVKYDMNGNVIKEVTYKMDEYERFNDLIVDGEDVIAVGHTMTKDKAKSTETKNVFKYDAFLVKYDLNLEKQYQRVFVGNHDEFFMALNVNKKHNYYVTGYSNSKDDVVLNPNGKDYFPFALVYNSKGKLTKFNSKIVK